MSLTLNPLKKMDLFLILGIVLLINPFSSEALDVEAQFKAYDGNEDSKWSRKEADYVLYQKNMADILGGNEFEGIDKNYDGTIDEKEFKASNFPTFLKKNGVGSSFSDVDSDGLDGILPMEFLKAVKEVSEKRMDAIFPSADSDGDGYISEEELKKARI